MGVIRHELVVIESLVTDTKTPTKIEAFRKAMPKTLRHLVVGPIDAPLNGYRFWAFCPDGSKEFWKESDKVNIWRAKFKALAPHDYDSVHVAWGDEEPAITDKSWDSKGGLTHA